MGVKKDHSVGEGTGAAAGAVTGAVVGSVGGPAGTLVGAAVGGIAGAKAGGAIAEAVNPTEYSSYFSDSYKRAPYYKTGREWKDYGPAYAYGYDSYSSYRGRPFNDVESDLERGWHTAKRDSRLAWSEAKEAVRDGWHYIERKLPGDADRDGR